MVFCNMYVGVETPLGVVVTILILIDGFLQYSEYGIYEPITLVTILILIDGFLQYKFINGLFKLVSVSQSLF